MAENDDLVLRLIADHTRAILMAEDAIEEKQRTTARLAVNQAIECRDSLTLIPSEIAKRFLERTLVRYTRMLIRITKLELN